MCQLLAKWHSCSITINGHWALAVHEAGPSSAVPAQKMVGGISLVMSRMDLDWLQNLFRGVNYSQFFGVEPHGVVDYSRILLESGRNGKIMEKLPA